MAEMDTLSVCQMAMWCGMSDSTSFLHDDLHDCNTAMRNAQEESSNQTKVNTQIDNKCISWRSQGFYTSVEYDCDPSNTMSPTSAPTNPGATTPTHGGDDSTLLAIILSVVAVGLVALVWYFKLAGKKIAATRKKSLVTPNTDFSTRKNSINKSISTSLGEKLEKTHGLANLKELDSDAHNIGANGQDKVVVSDTRKKSLVTAPNTDFSKKERRISTSLAVKLSKTHGLAKLTELDSYAHNIGANAQDNVLVSDAVAELKNDMDTQRMLIMEEHVSFVYDRNTREREILGKGAFGSVFLGVYMGAEVAVKEITSEQIDADSMGR